MKVVNFLFDSRIGGPQRRVVETASSLVTHGVETLVVIPDSNAEKLYEYSKKKGVHCVLLKLQKIPSPRDVVSVLRWFMGLPKEIKLIKELLTEGVDLVHVNGAFFIAPAIAAKLAGVPIVWHFNDIIVPKRMAYIFGLFASYMSKTIIVSSVAVAKHYGVKENYDVIYPPLTIPINRRKGSAHGLRDEVRIGMTSNWNPLKGIDDFVVACGILKLKLNKSFKIVFAGHRLDTHVEYAHKIDSLIKNAGLCNQVEHFGFVEEVSNVLDSLDLLVVCSTSEAFAMSALEGMSQGIPVVATSIGGIPELICDAKGDAGFLVPINSPDELAKAMMYLISNQEVADKMSVRGRIMAEKYSLNKCVKSHYNVYSSALGMYKKE